MIPVVSVMGQKLA